MTTFDAVHPTGTILFRSSRGGLMEGVQLTENAMSIFGSAGALAEAILLTGRVSHLKALMQVREEILAANLQPNANVPTREDLAVAETALRNHKW